MECGLLQAGASRGRAVRGAARGCVFLGLWLLAGAPAPGQYTERVSLRSDGGEPRFGSWNPTSSLHGRFVVFTSSSDDLVPGDRNSRRDIFVRDRMTGQVTRVSVSSSGAESDGNCDKAAISGDGRFVAFDSFARNLVPGCNDSVYVHDLVTGETTCVAINSDGEDGNRKSAFPHISADGRFVAFQSEASNLVPDDTNERLDTFVHDRATGETTRVSVASDGSQADGGSNYPSISADGRYVCFAGSGMGTECRSGIFVHDRQTGETTCASLASDGTPGNGSSGATSAISPDGRYVAFQSAADNLVEGDTNGEYDIFVHDRETGETRRVSVASDGTESNADSFLHSPAALSGNGQYVAFRSFADNLVPGDENGVQDVFVHDLLTGQTILASVRSDGRQGNDDSGGDFMLGGAALVPDGSQVLFASDAANLVPGDRNDRIDAFARARLALRFNGIPQYPSPVNYTVFQASSDQTGRLALVLLSCTGVAPFPVGEETLYLTVDACTATGLNLFPYLSAVVGNAGRADTPFLIFPPSIPPGLVLYSAALTLDRTTGEPVRATDPIRIVTH